MVVMCSIYYIKSKEDLRLYRVLLSDKVEVGTFTKEASKGAIG